MPKIIIFDLETTGFSPQKNRIIEIGAVALDGKGNVVDKFLSFVRPPHKVPKVITRLTGITNDDVIDAPEPRAVLTDFLTFCRKGAPDQQIVLVAHNAPFDKKFLHATLEREGMPLPQWNYLDTQYLAKKFHPDIKTAHGLNYKLQTLREFFGVPANHAHRALDDVLVLLEVFKKISEPRSIAEVVTEEVPSCVARGTELAVVGGDNPVNPFK